MDLLRFFVNDYKLRYKAQENIMYQLVINMRLRSYDHEEVVLHQGSTSHAIFFVSSHAVTVWDPEARKQVVDLKKYSYFGEWSILYSMPMCFSYVAVKTPGSQSEDLSRHINLFYVTADKFKEIVYQDPEFARYQRYRSVRRINLWRSYKQHVNVGDASALLRRQDTPQVRLIRKHGFYHSLRQDIDPIFVSMLNQQRDLFGKVKLSGGVNEILRQMMRILISKAELHMFDTFYTLQSSQKTWDMVASKIDRLLTIVAHRRQFSDLNQVEHFRKELTAFRFNRLVK